VDTQSPEPKIVSLSSKVFLQAHELQEGGIGLANNTITLYGQRNALFLECSVEDITRVKGDWMSLTLYIKDKKPELVYFDKPPTGSRGDFIYWLLGQKQTKQTMQPWLEYFEQRGLLKRTTSLYAVLLLSFATLICVVGGIYLFTR